MYTVDQAFRPYRATGFSEATPISLQEEMNWPDAEFNRRLRIAERMMARTDITWMAGSDPKRLAPLPNVQRAPSRTVALWGSVACLNRGPSDARPL